MAFTYGVKMAKRKSNNSGCSIIIVAIIAIASSAVEWSKEKANQELVVIAGAAIIGLFILRKIWLSHQHKKWINYLKNKYNNNMMVVNAIDKGEVWQGQSAEQLIDSIGRPVAMDRQVLKTKTKETWKYQRLRKGQYSLRIFLENDFVVGWDKKQ
jgi:hypothetical protein